MTTLATYSTTVTAVEPDIASGSIEFKNPRLSVSDVAEIVPPKSTYIMTLSALGVGSTDLPTPDGDGTLAFIWEVTSITSAGSRQYMGKITLPYSASAQALGVLFNTTSETSATYANVATAIYTWLVNLYTAITALASGYLLQSSGTNIESSGILAADVVTATSTTTLTNKTLDSFTNTISADDTHVQVRNESGGTLLKGTPVYASGYSVGQDVVLVSAADATSDATMPALGLVEADIANNATGGVITSGRLNGLSTNAYDVLDELYVAVGGGLTATRPTGTAKIQNVGIVLRDHPSQGIIEISGAGRTNDVPNFSAVNKFWASDSGAATADEKDITDFALTLLDDTDAATARATLGVSTAAGDVVGPSSSTDNEVPRYDLTTGKLLQNTATNPVKIGDTGIMNVASGSIELASNGTYYLTLSGSTTLRGPGRLIVDTTGIEPTASFTGTMGRQAREWASINGGGFLAIKITGITTGTTVLSNGTGDVTLVLSGTYTISDGAGNVTGGVITATAPSGTFNLYDDGGTNTCQLQVAADGSVVVARTAGSRTYAVQLSLSWL